MTKEELEKYTIDFMNNETGSNRSNINSFMGRTLIKYSEVFQKRIKDLEQKLEQAEKDLVDYQFNYPTIKELEKENAELKLKLEVLDGQTPWKDIKDKSELIKENAELKEELNKWKDEWQEQVQKATDEGYARTLQTIQLNKAKEIIKGILEITEDYKMYKNVYRQANQFIKDSEVK